MASISKVIKNVSVFVYESYLELNSEIYKIKRNVIFKYVFKILIT